MACLEPLHHLEAISFGIDVQTAQRSALLDDRSPMLLSVRRLEASAPRPSGLEGSQGAAQLLTALASMQHRLQSASTLI